MKEDFINGQNYAAAMKHLAMRNALLKDLREALDHCEENQSIIPAYWIDAIDKAIGEKNG